jgi:hypothetical protein
MLNNKGITIILKSSSEFFFFFQTFEFLSSFLLDIIRVDECIFPLNSALQIGIQKCD